MSPPAGTTGKGLWPARPIPPKDHYSPQACGNCHGDSQGLKAASVGLLNPYEPANPQKLEFLPSPSDCPAEIFWPDRFKTYQEFVQQNPYMKGQNYLETLLRSRQGEFPLEVKDSSLGVYLGLTGPTDLPNTSVSVPHNASLCAGPAVPGGIGMDACSGLDVELKSEDIGLTLEGLELANTQDLDLSLIGLMGVSVKQAAVRNGRLLLTAKLDNPFLNASFPLAYTSEAVLKRLNPAVSKLLRAAKPNPYDLDLHDIDITDMLLEKLTVAYEVKTGKGLNYAEYQATANKSDLKTIPFFFNMAREGKLPARLSFNQLYEAVTEQSKNVVPKKKTPEEEKKAEAQKKLLQGLLDTLALRAKLHPSKLLFKNLYVEFDDEPGKNLILTNFTLKNLQDADLMMMSSLQIRRLYSPGAIDILNLKGEVGLIAHSKGDSEFRVDGLEMELGRLEFTGSPDKEAPGLLGLFGKLKDHFTFDPSKPGKFAILGGRITSIPQLYPLGPFNPVPTFRVVGNPEDGFKADLSLRLDAVQLRLPMVGEVTVSGDLTGSARIVPQVEIVTNPDGSTATVKRWTLEPGSLQLKMDNLDVATASGLHWQHASIQITDKTNLPTPSLTDPSYVSLKLQAPEIEGSNYTSMTLDGELPIPRRPGDGYDFEALLKGFTSNLLLHAVRVGGNLEDWKIGLNGSHQPENTSIKVDLDSSEKDSAGTIKRNPIQDLHLNFRRDAVSSGNHYSLQADAKKIEFPGIQLNVPKFSLDAVQETTKNGGNLYTVSDLDFSANPWKNVPNVGLIRGPLWVRLLGAKKKPLTLEIDGEKPEFQIKNLNLDFAGFRVTPDKLASATKGLLTGVDVDGGLRGHWKMDYEKFSGKGMLVLAGDSGGEGDLHLRGSDGLRLAKDDPRDPTRLVEIPIFSKTTWTLWNIRGVDVLKERINGSFELSTKVDPAFARVFGVIIDNGKLINWKMTHDHLPYTAKGYEKKMEEYIATKAYEEKQAADAAKDKKGTPP